MGVAANGYGISLLGDGYVVGLGSGDSCKIL